MAIYPGATYRPIDVRYLTGQKITKHERINLHVQAGLGSLFHYFNAPKRASSTFWVSKAGKVEQYVDTALRAEADLEGNATTISIETEGGAKNADTEEWTPEQVKALQELIAWIIKTHPSIPARLATSSKNDSTSHGISWHRLGIDGNFPALPDLRAGRAQRGGGMYYSASRGKLCPGGGKILQIPGIVEQVKEMLGDEPEKPTTPSKPSTTKPPASKPSFKKVAVDGFWGPATTRRLQEVLGTPVDGVLSSQWRSEHNKNLRSAQWDKTARGSLVIRALQKKLGLKQDGLCGPDTIRALQARYGTPKDGMISAPSLMVKALQRRLNENRI